MTATITVSIAGVFFEAESDDQHTNLIIGPRSDQSLAVSVHSNTAHQCFLLTPDDEDQLLAYLQQRAAVREDTRTEALADSLLSRFGTQVRRAARERGEIDVRTV